MNFRMKMGSMYVDYKLTSRDHQRAVRVEDALVDPTQEHTVAPFHWLEALRSPSARLPTGFFTEEPVYLAPPVAKHDNAKSSNNHAKAQKPEPNAVRAGPVVMYITGQQNPVVLNMHFVREDEWQMRSGDDVDLRLGLDAIEQCSLVGELRPGGLLSKQSIGELKKYGMKCGLAESPLVPRPWTKMKYMFIDELQRGPKLTEFVGHNPRTGTPWRFSQHTKHFRQGIWRETTRKNEMHEGLHIHSSWQKSPQQSVPGVHFLAPSP